MTSVGVRELKSQLSAYLRRVRAGEPVAITDRGKAIAEIVPAGWTAAQPVSPVLAEAIRAGEVRPPSRSWSPDLMRPRIGKLPEGLAKQLLDDLREDR
ncbi:MAG: type II toxin-antitoxin system Phd/YefM family antitoxin [Terriglobales bacterium]